MTKTAKTEETQSVSSISETDLRTLKPAELKRLRDSITGILAEYHTAMLENDDVLVEYSVKLHTTDGVAVSKSGFSTLGSLLHKRLVTTAPSRVESMFTTEIFAPINAALFDVIDDKFPDKDGIRDIARLIPGGEEVTLYNGQV